MYMWLDRWTLDMLSLFLLLFDNFMIWVPYEGDFLGLSNDMHLSKSEMIYRIAIKMFLSGGIVGNLNCQSFCS